MKGVRKPGQGRQNNAGFTIIELLVVIGIIAILSGLLLPALGGARESARVTRVHSDLRQITVALQLYQHQYNVFPPARTYCASMMSSLDDYNHLPSELVTGRFLDRAMEDVFNPGRTYKYIAPGFGWANEAASILAIWVPDQFPEDSEPRNQTPYFKQSESPVPCAVWSVGPGGAKSVFDSDSLGYPLRPLHWYPERPDGLIVHYHFNNCWQSSP